MHGQTKSKCTYLAYMELLNFTLREYNPMHHVSLLFIVKTYMAPEKVNKWTLKRAMVKNEKIRKLSGVSA